MVNPPVISFCKLTLGYGKHAVLQQVNAQIPRGALLAIVGANGSGKSTLLKALVGELRPLSGSIHLHYVKARDLAYLPQRAALEQQFPINVRECVAMGLWQQVGAFGAVSAMQEQQIAQALNTVGLSADQQTPLSRLSGGQMQRVLFARLLLQNASVLLLDEPFNALDEKTIQDLMQLIRDWHQQGRTILTVLHDWALVRRYFPNTLWLTQGQMRYGSTAELLPSALERWAAYNAV
ncbi:MAG: ABC transporter ATP-binding protein [Thiothrix sp.]|nr:MAG: ABC transporter ATP-binding protein [Thiothrix sp.]